MKLNHLDFALFEYTQTPSKNDTFTLGDVVKNDEGEVGVIIQCQGNNEYRTDQFGNCCYSENSKYSSLIGKATTLDILTIRPSLFDHKNLVK